MCELVCACSCLFVFALQGFSCRAEVRICVGLNSKLQSLRAKFSFLPTEQMHKASQADDSLPVHFSDQ